MKKTMEIPRYFVSFPTGERELDACEMVRLYRERKINFSTMIRPLAGGDIRRFDADPEFAPLLRRLFQQQSLVLSAWKLPLLGQGTPLTVAIFSMILPWNLVRITLVFFSMFMLGYVVSFYEFCVKHPSVRIRRLSGIMIPYWNGYAGWRMFRELAAPLPEFRRKWVAIANPLFWILLQLFYLGGVFLPGNAVGGIVLTGILVALLLGGVLLAIPFRLGTRAEYRRWLAENPKPEFWEWRWLPLPEPRWAKIDWRTIIKALPQLGWIFAGIFVFLLPYYVVGTYRYHRVMEEMPFEIVNSPVDLDLGAVPEPSDAASDFLGFGPKSVAVPEAVRCEIAETLPQLDAYRNALRAIHLPPANVVNRYEEPEEMGANARNYLRFRWLEWQAATPEMRPRLTEALFEDLERFAEFQNAGSWYVLISGSGWSGTRARLLENSLRDVSLERLRRECEFWRNEERCRIVDRYAKLTILDDYRMLNLLAVIQDQWWLFPFRDGLKASQLQFTLNTLPLYQPDYHESKADLKRRDAENDGVLFSDTCDSLGQAVSRQRALSRLALAAIALEQYRREHGAYPENPALPRDPFSGEFLRYIPGKMVYSVSADGVDDGGRAMTRHRDDTTDMVFQLDRCVSEIF